MSKNKEGEVNPSHEMKGQLWHDPVNRRHMIRLRRYQMSGTTPLQREQRQHTTVRLQTPAYYVLSVRFWTVFPLRKILSRNANILGIILALVKLFSQLQCPNTG